MELTHNTLESVPEPIAALPAKRPRTLAQIEASRRNGAKSKGPITPEGKAVSSQNALKTPDEDATLLLIHDESVEGYHAHCQTMVSLFGPGDHYERDIVRRLADTQWRMRRAENLEVAAINFNITELFDQFEPTQSPAERAFAAVDKLAERRTLSLLNSQERRLDAQYSRLLRELRNHRKDKQARHHDLLDAFH